MPSGPSTRSIERILQRPAGRRVRRARRGRRHRGGTASAAPGCASSGSEPSRRIHSSGGGGTCGCGGPAPSSSSSAACSTGCWPNRLKSIPMPSVNVSRSRSVIGRSAGTVSSIEPSGSRITRRSASSGSHRSTASSSPTDAVGNERERGGTGDRLRHRRDPEDRARVPRIACRRRSREPAQPIVRLAPRSRHHTAPERPAVADVLRHPLIDVQGHHPRSTDRSEPAIFIGHGGPDHGVHRAVTDLPHRNAIGGV